VSAAEAVLTGPMVRWGYRFLLGREPETEAVIEAWCNVGGLAQLREGILVSPEMAGLSMSGFPEQGTWIENQPTEEAALACLILSGNAAPDDDAIQALRLRCPSLRTMRRFLLNSPAIEHRLPRPQGPRSRPLRLLEQTFTLMGDSREPEFLSAPGFAPRLAALLRAAWPDGGEGRVMVEAGAGIGVTTLGLAAGAPQHATLIAHEASLRRAASLATNLAENGLSRASSRAVAMGPVAAMMQREGLSRLDLLHLNEPGAARLAVELAPWLLERSTLTWISFDLGELLTDGGSGPAALLQACLSAFPHVVAFDAAHEPHPLLDEVALNAALHRTLMRPDRRDEFLLCGDLDWLDRYSLV